MSRLTKEDRSWIRDQTRQSYSYEAWKKQRDAVLEELLEARYRLEPAKVMEFTEMVAHGSVLITNWTFTLTRYDSTQSLISFWILGNFQMGPFLELVNDLRPRSFGHRGVFGGVESESGPLRAPLEIPLETLMLFIFCVFFAGVLTVRWKTLNLLSKTKVFHSQLMIHLKKHSFSLNNNWFCLVKLMFAF